MAKIIISLLGIAVLFLMILLLLIIGLSIALLVFSRKGTKRQASFTNKEVS